MRHDDNLRMEVSQDIEKEKDKTEDAIEDPNGVFTSLITFILVFSVFFNRLNNLLERLTIFKSSIINIKSLFKDRHKEQIPDKLQVNLAKFEVKWDLEAICIGYFNNFHFDNKYGYVPKRLDWIKGSISLCDFHGLFYLNTTVMYSMVWEKVKDNKEFLSIAVDGIYGVYIPISHQNLICHIIYLRRHSPFNLSSLKSDPLLIYIVDNFPYLMNDKL